MSPMNLNWYSAFTRRQGLVFTPCQDILHEIENRPGEHSSNPPSPRWTIDTWRQIEQLNATEAEKRVELWIVSNPKYVSHIFERKNSKGRLKWEETFFFCFFETFWDFFAARFDLCWMSSRAGGLSGSLASVRRWSGGWWSSLIEMSLNKLLLAPGGLLVPLLVHHHGHHHPHDHHRVLGNHH